MTMVPFELRGEPSTDAPTIGGRHGALVFAPLYFPPLTEQGKIVNLASHFCIPILPATKSPF